MNKLTDPEKINTNKKTLYRGWFCDVVITRYKKSSNRGLWRIDLIDSVDGKAVGTATIFDVMFEEEYLKLYQESNHICLIKSTEENDGMFEALYESFVITSPFNTYFKDGGCYIVCSIID
jgi:hypothetical protein